MHIQSQQEMVTDFFNCQLLKFPLNNIQPNICLFINFSHMGIQKLMIFPCVIYKILKYVEKTQIFFWQNGLKIISHLFFAKIPQKSIYLQVGNASNGSCVAKTMKNVKQRIYQSGCQSGCSLERKLGAMNMANTGYSYVGQRIPKTRGYI